MKLTEKKKEDFKNEILDFYQKNKRQFPWRDTADPYRILVSEVMLQQTQAGRVVEKYNSFIRTFPDFQSLTQASLQEVLRIWQGLGYNRRGIALKRIAEIVIEKYKGKLPDTISALDELPGIGEATASSISAFAWNKPTIFIETNIRRVYIYFFFKNKENINDRDIVKLVEETLDEKNPREWYYALMDYGAMLKGKVPNPNRQSAHYTKQSKFKGSNREVRGAILKFINEKGKVSQKQILTLPFSREFIEKNIVVLEREGFLSKNKKTIFINNG